MAITTKTMKLANLLRIKLAKAQPLICSCLEPKVTKGPFQEGRWGVSLSLGSNLFSEVFQVYA